MPKPTKQARLSIVAPAEPPSEFRIFVKGLNKTTKGTFLFDDEAARLVMSEYRKHGVDMMIDREHLSLDSESVNYDPSAYGWCKLELRNGELWAVGVTWTTAGARILREREARYISPAFKYNEDTGRVTELYNNAICAVPATYETPALVAASKRVGYKLGTLTVEVGKMDVEKILEALGLGKDATTEDVLAAIKALQEPDADDADAADDPDDKDKGDDDEKMAAALKDLPPKLQAKLLAATSSSKALQERIDKLEKDNKRGAVEALIAANANKLPKGLESWARKQDVETLTEYFKNAAPVAKTPAKPPKQKGDDKGSEDGEVTLTSEDIQVARLTGKTREQMLKMKIERLKKDKEKLSIVGGVEEDDDDEEENVA